MPLLVLARSDTLWLGAGGNVSQILFQCDRPLERTVERSQQLLLALYTPLAAFDPEVRTVLTLRERISVVDV